MWHPYTNERIGFLRAFSDKIASYQERVPGSIPNLRQSSAIWSFSDYGGEHSGAEFDSYAFLFTTPESVHQWRPVRDAWREIMGLGDRRMAYKRLSDDIRQRACYPFLRTADLLDGYLVSIAVHKSISSFFSYSKIDSSLPELAPYVNIKPKVLEKLFRILHLLGFFLGGLSASGQNFRWISDEDSIFANEERIKQLQGLIGNILSMYLRHDMGHVRYGTTASDPGDLSIEDLAAIPDIITGATSEAMSASERGRMPNFLSGELQKIPDSVPEKANPVFYWLSQPSERLSKMVFMIYPENDSSGAIRIIKLRYESK
jgi:hypothetical protein